jgi:cell division protein FtsI (penicillin-binding protein 3)
VARALTPATAESTQPVVQAAMRESVTEAVPPNQSNTSQPAAEARLPISGTVVLDVEQGGIEVPSFVGKTFRGAVEAAQDAGLELESVGSGVARQQSPVAGSHVPAGSRVTVQFGR